MPTASYRFFDVSYTTDEKLERKVIRLFSLRIPKTTFKILFNR